MREACIVAAGFTPAVEQRDLIFSWGLFFGCLFCFQLFAVSLVALPAHGRLLLLRQEGNHGFFAACAANDGELRPLIGPGLICFLETGSSILLLGIDVLVFLETGSPVLLFGIDAVLLPESRRSVIALWLWTAIIESWRSVVSARASVHLLVRRGAAFESRRTILARAGSSPVAMLSFFLLVFQAACFAPLWMRIEVFFCKKLLFPGRKNKFLVALYARECLVFERHIFPYPSVDFLSSGRGNR